MKLIAASIVALLLGACASGTTKFQCPTPDGVTCKSVSEIYNLTDADGEAGLQDARNAVNASKSGASRSRRSKRKDREDAPVVIRAVPVVTIVDPGESFPVLEPARVLRVLVTAWEDGEGDLHAGGYVFSEIEARKWSLGEKHSRTALRVTPLQVETSALTHPNSKAVPGNKSTPSGRESVTSPSAKPDERMSDGGG